MALNQYTLGGSPSGGETQVLDSLTLTLDGVTDYLFELRKAKQDRAGSSHVVLYSERENDDQIDSFVVSLTVNGELIETDTYTPRDNGTLKEWRLSGVEGGDFITFDIEASNFPSQGGFLNADVEPPNIPAEPWNITCEDVGNLTVDPGEEFSVTFTVENTTDLWLRPQIRFSVPDDGVVVDELLSFFCMPGQGAEDSSRTLTLDLTAPPQPASGEFRVEVFNTILCGT